MRALADYTIEQNGAGGPTLAFTGPMVVSGIGPVDRKLRTLEEKVARVDLSGVECFDTVGAWTAWRVARDNDAEIVGASDEASKLIDAVKASEGKGAIRPERENPLERIPEAVGAQVSGWGQGTLAVIGFLGTIILTIGTVIRHPRKFRMKSLVRQAELVGVSSLGIIGLMSFLIGIVIGQQGAVQLQQFGAEIYTINLIGRITVRELGTLMTAIMVAGRSGSAFAAQLGTMKITEEIDAMRTIGVSPIEALVIPRMIASVVMMPLLAFWAMLMSLLGGGIFVWLSLGIPPLTYVQRLQEVTPLTDLWVGLIKAPVFGFIIALAGCFQGMLVESNSEEVGLRTTTAVVQSIFLVIVLDSVFAVFFGSVGWI